MVVFIFLFLHWYLSLFFQTVFLHRYASHNMFKLSPIIEKIFFFLTFLFQGSSFLQPAAYGVMHRRHHAFADTPKDPHSPIYNNSILSFNWTTVVEYRRLVEEFKWGERNEKDLPRWPIMERIAESPFTRITFIFLYFLFYLKYSTETWQYSLLSVHILMGPIHGFIVNWFGHKIGYRNFNKLKDNSKNTLPLDILMMGELYQNNHHKYPNNLNFSCKWYEIDFGYWSTRMLRKLRIIN